MLHMNVSLPFLGSKWWALSRNSSFQDTQIIDEGDGPKQKRDQIMHIAEWPTEEAYEPPSLS